MNRRDPTWTSATTLPAGPRSEAGDRRAANARRWRAPRCVRWTRASARPRCRSRRGGSLPGAALLAVVLALLAQGMYRRRYWAVLCFEALLAFQVIVTSLALVVASTILAAATCLISVVLGGWLFWKLVRVMGRLQAGERQTLR